MLQYQSYKGQSQINTIDPILKPIEAQNVYWEEAVDPRIDKHQRFSIVISW